MGVCPAPIESELKFYVPATVAQFMISVLTKTEGIPPRYIEQHVLNPKRLRRLLHQYGVGSLVNNPEVFTSARARRTVEAGSERFLLEFKSPKGSDRISRFELGVPLDEASFKRLTRDHSVGCLRKLRYVIPGTVTTDKGTQSTWIELDKILDAGSPARPLTTPFFTADIEGSRSVLDAVREGRHSFNWLKDCITLTFADNAVRKPLSNKRLAIQGFDEPQITALKALTAL